MPFAKYLSVSLLASVGLLSACDGSGKQDQPNTPVASPSAVSNPMAAHDPAGGGPLDPAAADDRPRIVMQQQVVLDRLGFTPGVVDGKDGVSTRNALAGFQEANGLPITGAVDEATGGKLAAWSNIPATRVVTIPAEFAAGPFVTIPAKASDQAKLDCLCYQNLDEKLAERFHTTVAVLKELNPRSGPVPTGDAPWFAAGQQVRVPNVGGDAVNPAAVDDPKWATTLDMLGVGPAQPKAARVVVSKSKGTLKAFDQRP